jgi:hypothetical protein
MASRRRGSISNKAIEEMAEAIIQDQQLFLNLCFAVSSAAEHAVSRQVVAESNDICLLPTMESVERDIVPVCLKVEGIDGVVKFNPMGMTFVGGAAIHMYNLALKDILRHNFTRNTPDIDAVWWPEIQLPPNIVDQVNTKATVLEDTSGKYGWTSREHHVAFRGTNYIVVSASPAIKSLVKSFEATLQKELNRFLERNRLQLTGHIRSKTERRTPTVLEFKTASEHHIKSGVWNVQGNLHFYNRVIKLIEIAVHDGGSSQIPPVSTIEPQARDPIYLRPINTDITRLRLAGGQFSVPILTKLFDQQFFALTVRFNSIWNRFAESGDEKKSEIRRKVESHYRRCYYLLFIMRRCLQPQLKEQLANILGFMLHPQILNQYQQNVQNSIEWIASCPETLELCGIRADNPLLADACSKGIFLKKELCGKSTGPIFSPGNIPSQNIRPMDPMLIPLEYAFGSMPPMSSMTLMPPMPSTVYYPPPPPPPPPQMQYVMTPVAPPYGVHPMTYVPPHPSVGPAPQYEYITPVHQPMVRQVSQSIAPPMLVRGSPGSQLAHPSPFSLRPPNMFYSTPLRGPKSMKRRRNHNSAVSGGSIRMKHKTRRNR